MKMCALQCNWFLFCFFIQCHTNLRGLVKAMLYNYGMIFFILSFFVGYILSFGLVRLRTIRLSARAGAHIECSSRSRAEDVTITNVIIKTPDRKMGLGCEWCHARKRGAGNFGDFWKKQFAEIRTWARSVQLWSTGCARVCWVSELRF